MAAATKCQCGKFVAPEFDFCPSCGHPVENRSEWRKAVERVEGSRGGYYRSKTHLLLDIVVTVIFLGLVVWGIRWCSRPSSEELLRETARSPDAIDAAYALCTVAKSTGLTTGCDVSGWGKSVDLRVDTTSAEARKLCAGIADQMVGRGFGAAGWSLKVFSPYSGDQPIAVCPLR